LPLITSCSDGFRMSQNNVALTHKMHISLVLVECAACVGAKQCAVTILDAHSNATVHELKACLDKVRKKKSIIVT
jgi:hypothetical protein